MHAPLIALAAPERERSPGSITQDHFDVEAPWHSHDMHQLQYAFEGAMEVEDAYARHVLPHMLAAWIPAGIAHRTTLRRIRSGSILFPVGSVEQPGERIRVVTVCPLMRQMVIGAMRWPIDRPLDDIGAAYYAALAKLCSEWIHREAAFSLPTSQEKRNAAAIRYTLENLKTATMAGACSASALSERSLRRHFMRELGIGWVDYRRRARVMAAAAMLSESQKAIGIIAAEVGFESQTAFSKVFTALVGMKPSAFRRLERE